MLPKCFFWHTFRVSFGVFLSRIGSSHQKTGLCLFGDAMIFPISEMGLGTSTNFNQSLDLDCKRMDLRNWEIHQYILGLVPFPVIFIYGLAPLLPKNVSRVLVVSSNLGSEAYHHTTFLFHGSQRGTATKVEFFSPNFVCCVFPTELPRP